MGFISTFFFPTLQIDCPYKTIYVGAGGSYITNGGGVNEKNLIFRNVKIKKSMDNFSAAQYLRQQKPDSFYKDMLFCYKTIPVYI